MTRVETRRCPVCNTTCRGKNCALTSYRLSEPVQSVSGVVVQYTEWICDFSDRVVERE